MAGLVSLFVLAGLVGAELSRPYGSASIAFDSQMAVLHFDRILAGRHLETFIATTPKPFLTVVFGLLHWLTDGWSAIAWATVGAYAIVVVMAAVLARRLAGPVAGAFSAVAVLASPGLLFDVGFALATPWAAIGWFGAGLAVTARRPRYGMAGLLLLLATLARLETIIVTGVVVLFLGGARLARGRVRVDFARVPDRAWLVPLIALGAVPVMMLHDALLTGDPLFWTTVAGRYSAAHAALVRPPSEVVGFLIHRYWGSKAFGALSLLALLGLAHLGRRRSWSVLLGLLAFGPGVGLLLVTLAARGIFVSDRYAAPIDAAVAFAAGLGAAEVMLGASKVVGPSQLAGRIWPRLLTNATAAVVAAIAAAVIAGPYWRLDPGLRPAVARSAQLASDEARAVAVLSPALERLPHLDVGASDGLAGQPLVYAPSPIAPRLAIDLGLLTLEVSGLDTADLDVVERDPPKEAFVFLSQRGDPPSAPWASLETATPRLIAGLTIDPILADSEAGLWVLRLGGVAAH